MKIQVEITPTVARLLAEYEKAHGKTKGQILEEAVLKEYHSSKSHDDSEGINPAIINDKLEPPEPPKVAKLVILA